MDNSASKRPTSNGASSGSHKRSRGTSASAIPTLPENNIVEILMPLIREAARQEISTQLVKTIAPEPLPSVYVPLRLAFPKNMKKTIYTLNRIVFADNSPLQVQLITDDPTVHVVPHPIKLEILVIDAEFPPLHRDDDGTWTESEFKSLIIKERKGKPPLLAGDLVATLQPDGAGGVASFGEVKFTDNSRWVRSGKFRLGVRVIPGSCAAVRIREAVSEEFTVRERRGQYQEKHYPPRLNDPVWRLDGIAKGGSRQRELLENGILSVEHMLHVSKQNPELLEKILPSKKNREAILEHAMTCQDLDSKVYEYRRDGASFFFNSTCCFLGAKISEQFYTANEYFPKVYIDHLIQDAYANWNQVEEITL